MKGSMALRSAETRETLGWEWIEWNGRDSECKALGI